MTAILRKELKQYFASPTGYIYLGVFYLFAGFYFFSTVLVNNTTDLSYVFSGLFTICLFVIPLLTMRLFAEEMKNRTDQALFTAPVRLSSVVLGKYMAALLLFFMGTSETLLFAAIVDGIAAVDWAVVWGNFIGLMLLGAALIAICMFLSCMTESQLIAAVCGMTAGLLLMLTEGAANVLPDGIWRTAAKAVSFKSRYHMFTQGILRVSDIVFFLSIVILFCFLTVRRLEKRQWQ